MKVRSSIIYWGYLFLGMLIIFTDQYTKLWALQLPASGLQVTSFLILEPMYNTGISWGMFHHEQTETQLWLFMLITLVMSMLLLYIIRRWRKGHWILPEVLVLAGASSNFIDRINRGAVVDFIRFFWRDWAFPYFNLADVAIVVGVFGMLFYTFFVERHEVA